MGSLNDSALPQRIVQCRTNMRDTDARLARQATCRQRRAKWILDMAQVADHDDVKAGFERARRTSQRLGGLQNNACLPALVLREKLSTLWFQQDQMVRQFQRVTGAGVAFEVPMQVRAR
jgi:hypothetical protein